MQSNALAELTFMGNTVVIHCPRNRLPITCSASDGILSTSTHHFSFHIYRFVSADRIVEI